MNTVASFEAGISQFFTRGLTWAALALAVLALIALPVAAQSPNTGSIIVTVVDQNDAVVAGASITVTNTATGLSRDLVSNGDGSATVPALSLTGEYKVSVTKTGFTTDEATGLKLRAGETATVKVKLVVSGAKNEVTVFGTNQGVRADPLIGRSFDSPHIDETPILGRKVTTIPLLNSAFRQGKGTGDLFVNQTYFVTGVGSRRATTFTLDGANNDEGWGRQTAIATVPLGAVQEVTVLSNAFSAEFGWTSGPAVNIVTKSGTNSLHGEGVFMSRLSGMQAKTFSTKNYCPSTISTCSTPSTLVAINPVDIPDKLSQVSGSIGGPIIKDKTFFFATADYTKQDRTTFLSGTLPAFVLPADGHLDYIGHYKQELFDGRLDHRLTSKQNLMFRFNYDHFKDDNPQDAVGGRNAPSVARLYERGSWTTAVNHTSVISSKLLNEARFSYLHGGPVTRWTAPTISTAYTRGGSSAFTIGQSRSSDIYGHQVQFSDTLSWTTGRHYFRFGGSIVRHTSGGTGSEPGTATLGTFTFVSTGGRATLPFDQLTIQDVLNYQQPINFGISSYNLTQYMYTGFVQDSYHPRQDLTIDIGLRYDRQTITDAKKNFAPRIGFGWNPRGDSRLAIRGGYGMYYTQIRSNAVASYLVNGLDGLATYTATPGQLGFPTCLTGSCLPLGFDPRTLTIPARDITIQAGRRDFYKAQFAKYGINFDALPFYPEGLQNPRSQVISIGAEREVVKGLFVGADLVRQHLTGIDRTVDLNAPSFFDRTAVGQVRIAARPNNCVGIFTGTCLPFGGYANDTRPIVPVNNGVRQVNVLMNLGVADYTGLQTSVIFRGNSRLYASLSYTLSRATNTTEPDGNGIGPNQNVLSRLGEEERGPSVVDQKHRAVFNVYYRLPLGFTVGTLTSLASGRPFNATTGVDNNGDGATNDRPVINGVVIGKSAFRGTGTQDVTLFAENRIRLSETKAILLRVEGFNIFNHANMLGRGATVYNTTAVVGGVTVDTANVRPDFGAFTTAFTNTAGTNAIPAFANIDPPRMFQLQARFVF